MKKKKLKKSFLIAFVLLIVILIGFTIFFSLNHMMAPVSKTYEEKTIVIKEGMTPGDIASLLKKEKLIKNEKVFYYYLRLKKIDNIYSASYTLSPDMDVKKITKVLLAGGQNTMEIAITFPEGINMRKMAKIIENNTDNTETDVFTLLKDEAYLNELIDNYWFITKDIKQKELYYSLEGYLFPDTYHFSSKAVTVKEIFTKMLDQMEIVLDVYKKEIENSSYSIHELLALASMIELEGLSLEDREGIAGVFYNRLESSMSLGSDVTTYYAFKLEMYERDLTYAELNKANPYNTRGPGMIGKLPIGPIAMISKDAIIAIFNPKSDYYYFVADKNGKVYFTKNETEHNKIINKLINEGLWYEW